MFITDQYPEGIVVEIKALTLKTRSMTIMHPYEKTNKSGYICGGSWGRASSLTGGVLSEGPQLRLGA